MTNLKETQQKIQKILQESSDPLGPSAIAKKMGRERNTIFYALQELKKKGIVICPEKGKYSINKEEMEIIRELENSYFLLTTETRALRMTDNRADSILPASINHYIIGKDPDIDPNEFFADLELKKDIIVSQVEPPH